MVIELEQLTPVHQRLFRLLLDGLPHKRDELVACLDDNLAGPAAIIVQLSKLRKILRPKGMDVVCRMMGGRGYRRFQLVKLIGQDE